MNTLRCLIVSVLICCITAYPNGAPRNICGRYVPGGHPNMGTPVANGPRTGPYSVTVIPRGNGIFEVTLRSTTNRPFRGYVIQAMPSWKKLPEGPTDIVGSFQPDFTTGQAQVRSCGVGGSNVLTHTSSADKTVAQSTWQAPFNLPDPKVKFVATVVQDRDHFYVVHSEPFNTQDSQAGAGVDTGFGQQTTGSFGFSGTTQPGLSTGTGPLNGQDQSRFGQGSMQTTGTGSQFTNGMSFPGNRFGQNTFSSAQFGQSGSFGTTTFGRQPFTAFGAQSFGGRTQTGPFGASGRFGGTGQSAFNGMSAFGQQQTMFGQGANGQTAGNTNGFGGQNGMQGQFNGMGPSPFGASGMFGGQGGAMGAGQMFGGGGLFGGQGGMFAGRQGPFGGGFSRGPMTQFGDFSGRGGQFGGAQGAFGRAQGDFQGQGFFGGQGTDQFSSFQSGSGGFGQGPSVFGSGSFGPGSDMNGLAPNGFVSPSGTQGGSGFGTQGFGAPGSDQMTSNGLGSFSFTG